MRTLHRLSLIVGAAALLGACDSADTIVGGGGNAPEAPRDLTAQAAWVLDGFSGNAAVGHDVVNLAWKPPASWYDEAFRVYGRRHGDSRYTLLATVTSCTTAGCTYVDRDVAAGSTYDYYVATYSQQYDEETPSQYSETATVPSGGKPSAPVADSTIALDNALYVRWHPTGSAGSLWKYQVYITRVGTSSSLYQAGETDSRGFVDLRAANGTEYAYRIAAVDTVGRVSDLSNEITGRPRPDARAELIYAYADSAAKSGFQFQGTESTLPIVAGSSPSAQWRFEVDPANGWRIVPLNGTGIVEYGRTTDIACGPGADATCKAVTRAPAGGYQTTPIAVNSEYSYVLKVVGPADARPHYGVVRVTLLGRDAAGKALMIFDWAYQTAADDTRLDLMPRR
jgi:hypothetical protein